MDVVTPHFSYRSIIQNLKTGFDEEKITDSLLQRIVDYIQSWFISDINLSEATLAELPSQLLSAIFRVNNDKSQTVNIVVDQHYSIFSSWDPISQNIVISLQYNNWITKTKPLLLVNQKNYHDFIASALVKMIALKTFKSAINMAIMDCNKSLYEVFQTYLVEDKEARHNFLLEKKELLMECKLAIKLQIKDNMIYYGEINTGISGRDSKNLEFRGKNFINSYQNFFDENFETANVFSFLASSNQKLVLSQLSFVLLNDLIAGLADCTVWRELSHMQDIHNELIREDGIALQDQYVPVSNLAISKIYEQLEVNLERQ